MRNIKEDIGAVVVLLILAFIAFLVIGGAVQIVSHWNDKPSDDVPSINQPGYTPPSNLSPPGVN